MEDLRKSYQAKIREDMLSESAAGENRIRMYQEYFQVSEMALNFMVLKTISFP